MSDKDVSKSETKSTENLNKKTGVLSGITQSPGAKFIITGIITVLLMIPALLVWGLVEERADRAETVANSIANGWGGQQVINGPYLVVPYKITVEQVERVNNVNRTIEREVVRHAIMSPDEVSTISNIEVEERKKSIYSVPLYHMKSNIKGNFEALDLSRITEIDGKPDLQNTYMVMGISDTAGFRSQVSAKIGNASATLFKPGLKAINSPRATHVNQNYRVKSINVTNNSGGIHLPIKFLDAKNGFKFEMEMAINGSRLLSVIPNGKNTDLSIKSNWPHPGFKGRFLPETRTISEEGFSANWTIPNLARGIDSVTMSSALPLPANIQVNFVEPLKFYQVVSRTLKYAIAFFSLVFLAVFILELMGKKALHWIQYILVGLAMVIFYIMLLALAEHVGFNLAYLISALATTALIAWYVGDSLGQKNGAVIMAVILGVMYTIVFLVLKEQEYALLAGSIIAFLAIATTMYATRRVDWSKSKVSET